MSGVQLRARAYAKINLGLRIIGQRPDGFHELRTVYQTIALADRVELQVEPGQGVDLELSGDCSGVSAGPDNLAVRAAEAARDAFGGRKRIVIRLLKRIPAGAGLGGGSSDAAVVLRLMAVAMPREPPPPLLRQIAAKLGSDVPLFLTGGTVLGLGRGEETYPLPDLPAWHCLLVIPAAGSVQAVATPEAFRRWDTAGGLTDVTPSDRINRFCSLVNQVLPAFRFERNRGVAVRGRKAVETPKVQAGIENDFATVVFSLSPDFSRIRRQLLRSKAEWVGLTGSGAAQYGLFARREGAVQAAARWARNDRIWISRFVNRSTYRRSWGVVQW